MRILTRAVRSIPPDTTLADLERLAAVSEHLLTDLGFVSDGTKGGDTVACWRRGDLAVYVAPKPGDVDIRAVRLRGTGSA